MLVTPQNKGKDQNKIGFIKYKCAWQTSNPQKPQSPEQA